MALCSMTMVFKCMLLRVILLKSAVQKSVIIFYTVGTFGIVGLGGMCYVCSVDSRGKC